MSFALQARRSHHKKKTLSFRITSLSFSCGGVRSRTDVLRATSATLAPQKKDAILPNNVSFFFLWRSSESNRCPSRYKRDARTTKKKTLSFRITSLSFSCGGVQSRTDVLRATSATLATQKKDAILPNNVSFFFLWRSSESNR